MTTASEHKEETPKHGKAKRTRKHAGDMPRDKDGELDLKAIKEARREAPGEEPLPPETSEKPAIIHPLPHTTGIPHEAGTDPEEIKDEMRKAWEDGEPGAVNPDDPLPDYEAQNQYGLRKAGRLWRARQEGLPTLLIECDTAEQAKDAYLLEVEAESERREGGKKKGEKSVTPLTGPLTLPAGLPAGTTITVGSGDLPKPRKELVRVRRLTEGMGPPLPGPPAPPRK